MSAGNAEKALASPNRGLLASGAAKVASGNLHLQEAHRAGLTLRFRLRSLTSV